MGAGKAASPVGIVDRRVAILYFDFINFSAEPREAKQGNAFDLRPFCLASVFAYCYLSSSNNNNQALFSGSLRLGS